MDISTSLMSLEETDLAAAIRDSLYIFPVLESIHVMALSVVFGTVMIIDLRLLGIASAHRPFGRMSSELLRITWGAFAVAALTGSLMFMTNARVYVSNTSFQIKMMLLALAGLNMAIFHLTAGRMVARWDEAPAAPGLGKLAASLSLALWVAVIFTGRVVGFTTTGAQARQAALPDTNFDDFLTGGAAPAVGPEASAGSLRAKKPMVAAAEPPQPTGDTARLSIRGIMASVVDPSGDFLFESIADIADEHGTTHKVPTTPQEWEAVRHHLRVLVDAQKLLIVPGLRAAEPGDRSSNPAVENEPEQVQRLLDSEHSDFVRRAERLAEAAGLGLKATDTRDTSGLFAAITAIDKACESCHLHYWYPNDQRAHQAAREEGGIIE